MLESTIIALREGIEIALVLGIVLTYLKKINKDELTKAVYYGFAAAIVASIGGAFIIRFLGIDSESLEGFFLAFAAIFVFSMVIWMWITAKQIRTGIEKKLGGIVQKSSATNAFFGIFAFTFLMIVREGMETVLFLQAVALSAGSWGSILGTATGLFFAAIFGVLFVRGSVRINLGRFLKVTACTLLIFTLQLMINAMHEFYEYGIFPPSPKAMAILGPIVQNDVFFFAAIFSIPAFMLIIPGPGQSSIRQKRWQMSAGIAALCITLFLGATDLFSSNASMDLSSESMTPASDGTIAIPLASVSDGKLHRYEVRDSSLTIRFFVLKTGAATYATAFDACRACYSYGRYYLKNDQLICSQCDAPSPLATLRPSYVEPAADTTGEHSAMEGNGCHPIYLPSYLRNGTVVIIMADLRKERQYFDISPESN